MLAGAQGGKTSFGPWWLEREIFARDGGDYIAVTASFDLFKLKMLPTMLDVYSNILGIGRLWTGDKVIEILNPYTGEFQAKRSSDPMWARIILRSADALGGLESATARAAWLDECGQDRFTFSAYKAIRRRIALYQGRMLLTTTLYNLGWLTQEIIDVAIQEGSTQFFQVGESEIDLTDAPKRNIRLIQFDSILNPLFPKVEYDEQRQLMPDEEFQMLFRGRKGSRRFLIFDNFDYAKHTIMPFPIPQSWKRYIGLDFGGSHTCAMFYAEEPGTGKLYCYREYMAGGRTIKEHIEHILQNEETVPICYGGSLSEDQWRQEFGMNGLTVYPPIIGDLDIGINRVYAQHSCDGIIYFRTMTGIIDEKGRYRRKRDKTGAILSDIELKNTFHHLDGERYVISTIRPGVSLKAKIKRLGDSPVWAT